MVKELVEYIAKQLVDRPDEVRLKEVDRGEETTLELHVAPEDVGKVIGREGRTVRAVRTLLSTISAAGGRRVFLEIPD